MNRVVIHKKNILHNYEYLQSLRPQASIFPVLKSNAYGHGLVEMAKIMNDTDAPYLVIDSIPEYFQAREYTKKRFLLLGETLPHNYKKLKADRVTFAVYNVLTLEYLLSFRRNFTVHFFLNTGMNRE
jgi:alanine racemase